MLNKKINPVFIGTAWRKLTPPIKTKLSNIKIAESTTINPAQNPQKEVNSQS